MLSQKNDRLFCGRSVPKSVPETGRVIPAACTKQGLSLPPDLPFRKGFIPDSAGRARIGDPGYWTEQIPGSFARSWCSPCIGTGSIQGPFA